MDIVPDTVLNQQEKRLNVKYNRQLFHRTFWFINTIFSKNRFNVQLELLKFLFI